ncbi:SUMF1/EgtB/PvdO family nonheme iron enzyme [Wenxinia marina]|uniref:SUMF1/EgtB/PvdO family nonheme iron enzyme n=1 Tax=Wenxinia marina TaxID=390641 RepID=UPI0020C7AC43|nr:SUMF1/EgtB/PvdO family nonheme iron enzyme [Wenxinia marina]
MSEDCPPRLGAYGDPLARTPHLDRLAAEGVTWDAACSTSPVCAPSRFAILTGRHAESLPPAENMRANAHLPAGTPTYPAMMREAGYYCTNNEKTDYNCDVDPAVIWDACGTDAHWKKRPEGAPFLAVFNSMITHESCVFREQEGPVRPQDVTLPPHLPDTPGMRQSLSRYYNRIAQVDAALGARLREMEEAGLADDTIVLYHSDHASPLPRSKRFCYDDGIRVPLIVRVPERWRHLVPAEPGTHVGDPVSLVDILPTLAALAGVAPPSGLHGQSFLGAAASPRTHAFSGRGRMDERHDLTRTARGRRYRYIRNYAPHRPWGQHYAFAWLGAHYQDYEAAHLEGTLDPVQARFWSRKPAEELYDMDADPDAIRDLAGEAGHEAVLRDMRGALDAHMLAVRDLGLVPEGSAAAAEAAEWPEARLKDLMDLAGLAIRRDPAKIPDLQEELASDCAARRYWAAQGLLMLAVEGEAPAIDLGAALDAERDPVVRIALAEAWGHAGDAEAAVRWLTDAAAADDPILALSALEALTCLPLFPDITLPLASRLAVGPDEYVRGAAAYLERRLDGTYTPDMALFRFDLLGPGFPPYPAGRPAGDGMTAGGACCAPVATRPGGARTMPGLDDAAALRLAASAISIPGGRALIGTDRPSIPADGEGPLRTARLAPFRIGAGAVTNAEFADFVAATGHMTEAERFGWSFVFHAHVPPELGPTRRAQGAEWWCAVEGASWRDVAGPGTEGAAWRPDHPVVHVSWHDARAYAAWAGGRLPTEAEWEHAARGGLGDVRHPWGDALPEADGVHPCNIWQGEFPHRDTGADGYAGTAPARSFDSNGYGLYNVVGNVWEWTADPFRIGSLKRGARERARAQRGHRVAKGGSFLCHASYCDRYRIAARIGNAPESTLSHTGFRVVWPETAIVR